MNTFGNDKLQFGLCDPRNVSLNRKRFRRGSIAALAKASSFYCPLGRAAAKGWILLPRYEYEQLDSYSRELRLYIDTLLPLKNLSVIQAQCVTTGLSSDPDALYFIEVTDARGILSNPWFQYPTNSQYNIRAPAYPGEYYVNSLNAGIPWIWNTLIQDLWDQMGSFLGAYPGLPIVPTGTPEKWSFIGVSAWDALCDVLQHLGLAVACDLTQNSPYTIVYTGADDVAFAAQQQMYSVSLEDDLEWLDTGSGRVPQTITVYFRLRNEYYGTEETVRRDSRQWSSTPLYGILVNAPTTFANATGAHFLRDDFTIRQDIDGVPKTADVATATTIAAERVTQYFARIYSQTSGYMSQTYAGALPFKTGSQVDSVCWSQDYSCQDRQGWKTMIMRGSC